MSMKRNVRRKRKGSGHAALVLFLLFALAIGILLTGRVFVIKTILVVGNAGVPASDIVAQSGLEMGHSMFKLDEADVARRFDGIGRINFEGIDAQFPSTVTVKVRERVGRVLVNYAGLPTVLDEYGYAIEQAREMPQGDYPEVVGLRATSCQVGRQIHSDIIGQVEAMCKVVTQLYTQQLAQYVSELNVSDLDNLYLLMHSGMRVKLGDSERLPEKFACMTSSLNAATAEGNTTGVMDVSSATFGVYQPAG